MPKLPTGHGRDPRVGLDAADHAVIGAARAAVGSSGNWSCRGVGRHTGLPASTVRERVARLIAMGAWPFPPPQPSRTPDAGRRLDEPARGVAAAHFARARSWARMCARQFPHLADEFESAAMLELVHAARRARGDVGKYLTVALASARSEVLRAARPKGFRRRDAPMLLAFAPHVHGELLTYRDADIDDLIDEADAMRRGQVDRIQYVVVVRHPGDPMPWYLPSDESAPLPVKLVSDPAYARKFCGPADALSYIDGHADRFESLRPDAVVGYEAYPRPVEVGAAPAAANGHAGGDAAVGKSAGVKGGRKAGRGGTSRGGDAA